MADEPVRRDETLLTVRQNGDFGWQVVVTSPDGAVQFVPGPALPPVGDGSARLFTGTNGDLSAELRLPTFNLTPLEQLDDLRYWTYETVNNAAQWPYIILQIDFNGDTTVDDLIFFEPIYQTGYVASLPQQGAPVLNRWQVWNALVGGWWSLNSIGGATPGAGVKPISTYITAVVGAGGNPRIVNSPSGNGGIRLLQGFASPADVYDGNVDAFSIKTLALSRSNLYNFDPMLVAAALASDVPPPPPPVRLAFFPTDPPMFTRESGFSGDHIRRPFPGGS